MGLSFDTAPFLLSSMKGGLVFYAVHIDCSRLSVV